MKKNIKYLFLSLMMTLLSSETVTNVQSSNFSSSSLAVTEAVFSPPPGKSLVLMDSNGLSTDNESLTPEEIRIQLREEANNLFSLSKQRQADLENRAYMLGIPMDISNENGRIYRLSDITATGEALYLTPFDIASSITVNAYQLTNSPSTNTLSGINQVIGLWDPSGVVRTTHNQFSYVTVEESQSTIGNHATWVAGMIASQGINSYVVVNNNYYNVGTFSLGVSPNANIVSYNTDNLIQELNFEASEGLKLSVHSYGISCGWKLDNSDWIWYGNSDAEDWRFGAYLNGTEIGTAQIDQFAHSNPNGLLVFAASNDRNFGPTNAVTYYLSSDINKTNPQTSTKDWSNGDEGGYDSLSPLECAKNVLTVGGIYDIEGGYTETSDVTSATFSGMGPTDDGRIKPDVVAVAIRTGVVTSNYWNNLGLGGMIVPSAQSDTSYLLGAVGNSFAAPVVAGGLGLILETRDTDRPEWIDNNYPIQGATLKALIIHTADDAGKTGPDYTYGYGLVNIGNANSLMHKDITSGTNPANLGPKSFIKEVLLSSLQNNASFKVRAENNSIPLKVTICWNDPQGVGQTNNVIDETTKRLVNDLDLRIKTPTNVELFPFTLDPDLTNKTAFNRGKIATNEADDSRNNVEQIVISNPDTTGDYTVNVTYKGNSLSGNQQWVSIIISGNEEKPVDFRVTRINNLGDGSYLVKYNTVVGGVYRLQGAPNIYGPWIDRGGETVASLESTATYVESPNGETSYYWRAIRIY